MQTVFQPKTLQPVENNVENQRSGVAKELDQLVKLASQMDRADRPILFRSIVKGNANEGKRPAQDGNHSPLVRIVDFLIGDALGRRASDIHIEPHENEVLIRNSIDGVLRNTHSLPRSLHAPLISRIKILGHMDIAEKRLPQDGRMKTSFANRRVDLRVSTIPVMYGEKAVLRLLDVGVTSIPLEGIGFTQGVYDKILSLLREPQGVFFVSGPTGSGKTSSLYACVNHINSRDINIITLKTP